MANPRFKAIVFDWDGTLVDTAEPTFRCYRKTLAEFGIDFCRDSYERTYAPAGEAMFEALGLDPCHWDKANERWVENFAGESVPLIPGAVDALRVVSRHHRDSAVVTSGTRRRVIPELHGHGLISLFQQVVCGDDTPHRKPRPEPLLHCLEKLGVAPEESAYIGDSADDVFMARAAGVFVVGVPGPYPNREKLLASRPDILSPDLTAAIRTLLELD